MLKFNNGKFRIMQVADIQEMPKVHPDSIKLLTLAIEKEKPDLIVFSGDQIYGMIPMYKGNTDTKVKNTISAILEPVVKNGIPFAVTFGNHDRQCGISNIQQARIYSEFPGFVASASYGDANEGVCSIPVFNNDKQVFDVVIIDSNGQLPSGEYEPVKENQLDSFIKQQNRIYSENGKYLPFVCIQHIPTEEFYNVIKKVPFYTKSAVEAFRTHKHEFYTLYDEQKKSGGFMYESPATPDRNSGEFEILIKNGNCLALAVGHDHYNSFVAPYNGTDLIYTQGCGFNVYGPKLNRGVRIFDIYCNNEDVSYSTHTVTYKELTDDKPARPLQEFVLTHIPTSMEQIKKIAVAGGIITLSASAFLFRALKK